MSPQGIAAVLALGAACAASPPKPSGPTAPHRMCVGEIESRCRSAASITARLHAEDLRVLHLSPLPGGTQGGRLLTLAAPDGVGFEAKWRSWRRRSATHLPVGAVGVAAVQEMILEPRDYVVPPAAVTCLPLSAIDPTQDDAEAVPGTDCALGALSYWLRGTIGLREAQRRGALPDLPGDVSGDPELYSPERFDEDPVYRRNVANLNVLMFLVNNGDAHAGQFVAYTDPLHVFMVDNSVVFGLEPRDAMEGRQDLSELLVPAIPASTAARLRGLDEHDLERLADLASLERRGRRLVRRPRGEPFGDRSARLRDDGRRVQVGLTSGEVAGVKARLQTLQERLADGTLDTFH